MRGEIGSAAETDIHSPLRGFLEVLILNDFKSLFPEVLILVEFKRLLISEMQRIEKFLEVLILEGLRCTNCKNG